MFTSQQTECELGGAFLSSALMQKHVNKRKQKTYLLRLARDHKNNRSSKRRSDRKSTCMHTSHIQHAHMQSSA